MRNHIKSIQFTTDDGECVSVFIEEAIAEIDEDGSVNMQIPVFADGRSGHIYATSQEASVISRSPLIKGATEWALSSRMMNYKPRN